MTNQWTPAGPAVLFCPAHRPERFDKGAERADLIIIDLEDGCDQQQLAAARDNLIASRRDPEITLVRIHAADHPERAADIAALQQTDYRIVLSPKTQSAAELDDLAGYGIIANIEDSAAAFDARDFARHSDVIGLTWGSEDLSHSLGGTSARHEDGSYRDVHRQVRALTRMAAAAEGVFFFDAVYAALDNVDGFARVAEDAAAQGAAGSLCIHPKQAEIIRQAYAPSPAQQDFAREVLEGVAVHGESPFTVQGVMVDAPMVLLARTIAQRAGLAAAD